MQKYRCRLCLTNVRPDSKKGFNAPLINFIKYQKKSQAIDIACDFLL